MRHLITVGFILAALVAYMLSFSPSLAGAAWLAGALFAVGVLCELALYFRLFARKGPSHWR